MYAFSTHDSKKLKYKIDKTTIRNGTLPRGSVGNEGCEDSSLCIWHVRLRLHYEIPNHDGKAPIFVSHDQTFWESINFHWSSQGCKGTNPSLPRTAVSPLPSHFTTPQKLLFHQPANPTACQRVSIIPPITKHRSTYQIFFTSVGKNGKNLV